MNRRAVKRKTLRCTPNVRPSTFSFHIWVNSILPHPPLAFLGVSGFELTGRSAVGRNSSSHERTNLKVPITRLWAERQRPGCCHPPTNLGFNGGFNFLVLAERKGKKWAERARPWVVAAVGKRQLLYSWLIRCVCLCVASVCYCCWVTCERGLRRRGHSCSKPAALTSASFSSG